MAGLDQAQRAFAGIEVQGSRSTIGSGKGRSAYATRDFAPGQLIARFDTPLIVLPSSPTAKSVCNQCLSLARHSSVCTGCRAVAYCGVVCQKLNWNTMHKKECKAFKLVQKSTGRDWLPTPVRAAIQLLLRWGPAGGGLVTEAVTSLEDNINGFRKKRDLWADIELQAMAVCAYTGRKPTAEHLELACAMLCKIQTNSFDRSDVQTGYTGCFLDATLAMVNHSCIPNAVVVFANRQAYLKAESPIIAGEEITISYIGKYILMHGLDYTKPKLFRQRALDLYHFECSCPRCTDDLNVYQVCQLSPLLPSYTFLEVVDASTLRWLPGRKTQILRDPHFREEVDRVYAACTSDAATNPPGHKLALLRRQWEMCAPLVEARIWAVEPLAQLFQRAILYYSAQQDPLCALVVACFVASETLPYQYPAPFNRFRLEGLLVVAKIMTTVTLPSREILNTRHPEIEAVLKQTDEAALYEGLLLIIDHYGSLAHSEDWEILFSARDMLRSVQESTTRQQASKMLRDCFRKPPHHASYGFFAEKIWAPVKALAALAVAVLEADLS